MAEEIQKKQKSISPIGSALLGNSIDMGFGAIGSGIQTLFGIASSKYNADLEYQYNKKLADDAYQRQLDFWNLQNAYNTPAAQMSRLRQAGLNPALLNGGVQGNTAGDLSSVPTASVSAGGSMPSSPAANLGAMAETMSKLASAGMIDEQTKYWLEQAIGAGIENDVKRILRAAGWSDAAIKEMDRAARWKAAYPDEDLPDNPYFDSWAQSDEGVNDYVDTSENKKADTELKQEQKETEVKRQANFDALTETENALRSLTQDQFEQNIAESKQRVKVLDAESKKLIRETEQIDNLIERQDILNAANAFYGITIDTLPPTLQFRLMDNWQKAVRGEIYEETALRVANRAVEDYRTKELHIQRTKSWNESKSISTGSGPFKRSGSESYGWTETY